MECRTCKSTTNKIYERQINCSKCIYKKRKQKFQDNPELKQKILDKKKDYHNQKYHSDQNYRQKCLDRKKDWEERTGQNETYQCQFCNSLFSKKSIKRHINLDWHKSRILYYNEKEPNNTKTIIKYEI